MVSASTKLTSSSLLIGHRSRTAVNGRQRFGNHPPGALSPRTQMPVSHVSMCTPAQSVATVASSLSGLSFELGSNLAEARQMHALQEGTAEAATHLSETLAELTEAAHNGMQNITGTAQGLRRTMMGHDRLAWGREAALWVCGVILRGRLRFVGAWRGSGWLTVLCAVDRTDLERLAGIPAIRAFILVVRVVGWCIHAAASSSVVSHCSRPFIHTQ